MGKYSDTYDIVFLGNYTKDTIISRSIIKHVDGGGFNYGARAAVMMGLRVAAVTRLAKEDYHVIKALNGIGVDVFPIFTPKSTHMQLHYPTSNMDERFLSVASTAGAFTPDQVETLSAKAFVITASTRGEVPLEVIEALRRKGERLVADAQSFVRVISPDGTLVYEEWPEKRRVLSRINILKTDAVEAEVLTGETNIEEAVRKLAELGPKEVVLTHRGGVLVYANGQFHQAQFFPKKLIGRSGRGDTCIGSYMAKRLTSSPEEATIWAAAVTSLKMESEGPIRRDINEVEDLIRIKYSK